MNNIDKNVYIIDMSYLNHSIACSRSIAASSGARLRDSTPTPVLCYAMLYAKLRHNPRCHIHRRQLLKEQLTRIRYLNQRKVRAIVTRLTKVDTPFFIIRRDNPAFPTHMNLVFVGAVIHTPLGKSRSTVSNHRITLHLSKT